MQSPSPSLAKRSLLRRGLSALVLAGICTSASVVYAKPYKGAEIYSQGQYKYGRVEVRMRAARGSGILSTFFTYKLGSETEGQAWEEIDVEIFGKSNAAAFQSNILAGNPRMGSEQEHPAAASLADGYHTYTIEWTATYVAWLFDGVEVRRTVGGQVNELTTAHNFRFNLWASDVASWAGAFESSALPAYQYVNWIRYYRYENGAFVLDWTDDFNSFDTARWSKADWTFDGNLVDFDPTNAVTKDGTLVLCLTAEGQGGCSGAVPPDSAGGAGGTGGGGAGGAAGGGGAAGAPMAGTGGSAAGAGGVSSGGVSSGGVSSGGGNAAGGSSAGAGGAAAGAGGAAAGASGAPTTGGASVSTAGAPAGVGGNLAPSAGGTNGAVTPTTPADRGCGCSVPGKRERGALALALALGLGLAASKRRARRK